MKKQFNTKYMTNKKMNDKVYSERRQVMDIVYEAKKLLGDKFERVDVRIGKANKGEIALGVGRLNMNIIWIEEKTLTLHKNIRRQIVLHEIVHALTGFGHDDKCPLMKPCVDTKTPLDFDTITTAFLKYF